MYRPATFAERLNAALELKDMTKADLSRLTGISKSSLTRYAKGDWEGKQDAVYAISQALNINEAWLMGYDAPMERIDMEALVEAEKKMQEKDAAFLSSHTGVIFTNDGSNNVGCSIHCRTTQEAVKVKEVLLRITMLSNYSSNDKLSAVEQLLDAIQHMPADRCSELISYAKFLQQK